MSRGGVDGGGGGKEEEKLAGAPLFPRLHVNDAGKGGGPRPPPRNKMALYEQFSVPSQKRFNAPPRHPQGISAGGAGASTGGAPSASSSQGCGVDVHKGSFYPSFPAPSNEPNSSGRSGVHPISKASVNPVVAAAFERNQSIGANRQRSSKHGVGSNGAFGSAATTTAAAPAVATSSTNLGTALGQMADDFIVPTIFGNGFSPGNERSNPSGGAGNAAKRGRIDISEPRSAAALVATSRDQASTRKEPSRTQADLLAADKCQKIDRQPSVNRNESICEESAANSSAAAAGGVTTRLNNMRKTVALSSRGHHAGELKSSRTGFGHRKGGNGGIRRQSPPPRLPPQYVNGGQQEDCLSDCSADSVPHFDITPDDVVSAIGTKHFWKVRIAIINQQRVFAVQVFELHRLIKVQKLLAGSPDLLLEGDAASLGLSLPPPLPEDVVAAESSLKALLLPPPLLTTVTTMAIGPDKDDLPRPSQNLECSRDNTEVDDRVAPDHSAVAVNGAFLATNPSVVAAPAAAPENVPSRPWCLHAPNQWLVPVMSPSEGLIYKMYSGMCPPANSILAPGPLYSGLPQPTAAVDFMSPGAYGISVNHQQLVAPSYFPPFGLPMVNPVTSISMVEQVPTYHGATLPTGLSDQRSWASSNMLNMRSEALSGPGCRPQESKDGELQGSTASSPFKRTQREGRAKPALPPAVPTFEQLSSSSRENMTVVIKVVPHNPRTAAESAARIFRSIQLERRQTESQ